MNLLRQTIVMNDRLRFIGLVERNQLAQVICRAEDVIGMLREALANDPIRPVKLPNSRQGGGIVVGNGGIVRQLGMNVFQQPHRLFVILPFAFRIETEADGLVVALLVGRIKRRMRRGLCRVAPRRPTSFPWRAPRKE